MARKLIVIGAGMGGLTAALYLAQRGYQVQVFEARDRAGGLASGHVVEGLRFDAGPYILLDRPGLEWAFNRLDFKLDDHIELCHIDSVYEVASPSSPAIRFYHGRDQTAHGIESNWAGSAHHYLNFISRTETIYQRLQPLQWMSRPGLRHLVRTGAWRDAAFLLRSLGTFLSGMHLPQPLINAIGIWTHVAGQTLAKAPSPLAFVPALIHRFGAYYPAGGIGAIPEALTEQARAAGVSVHYQTIVDCT
ncbi:phytoene desaturase family protein [Candidatus Entotheonella palauensis]|uniref:phytoene desaturase family protein n=1 Tax=Candidatus Entotheonella palauensis TaxID=93172 RepID=UPI000B7FEA98|nr:NAD(P)/FAD-dependent oxidoreductase [Candidatus Entotheonella palauensis]